MYERHLPGSNPGHESLEVIRNWVKTNQEKGPITNVSGTYSTLEKAFFDSTLQPMGPSATERLAPISWYRQLGSTCTAWTILNGTNVLGLPFPFDYIAYIHNIAENAGGLELADAKRYLNGFNLLFSFDNIATIPTAIPDQPVFSQNVRKRFSTSSLIVSSDQKSLEKDEDKQVVKGIIDRGAVILTSVKMLPYMNRPTQMTHSLMISGYQYDDITHNMNVQLIDPARGMVLVSWDHIKEAIIPGVTHEMFRVRK